MSIQQVVMEESDKIFKQFKQRKNLTKSEETLLVSKVYLILIKMRQ